MTYADAILNGTLYVSETFDGAPFESTANIDWDMNFTESPNTFQLYLQGLTPLETLGRAWDQTGDIRYLEAGKTLIESWNLYRQEQERLINAEDLIIDSFPFTPPARMAASSSVLNRSN